MTNVITHFILPSLAAMALGCVSKSDRSPKERSFTSTVVLGKNVIQCGFNRLFSHRESGIYNETAGMRGLYRSREGARGHGGEWKEPRFGCGDLGCSPVSVTC